MRARKTIEKCVPHKHDRIFNKNYNLEDINYLILEVLLDIRDIVKKIPSNKPLKPTSRKAA